LASGPGVLAEDAPQDGAEDQTRQEEYPEADEKGAAGAAGPGLGRGCGIRFQLGLWYGLVDGGGSFGLHVGHRVLDGDRRFR
jgi:hypothetical protein